MFGILFGVVAQAAGILGILLGIALKILGLPYAITIGAAAAVLGIIPYIGMISTSIPAMVEMV